MMAALPLDGDGACFEETLGRLQGRLPLDWTCFGSIDLGHPWKTTPGDLRETLLNAGFTGVRLVQRDQHLTVFLPLGQAGLTAFRKRCRALRAIFLEPIRKLLSFLFGRRPPYVVKRMLFAVESRIWFGGNRFKNAESPEVLVIAMQS